MTAIDKTSCIQLRALVESGLSVEEAAEALDLDVDAAKDYLTGEYNREVTAEELIKRYKPQMIQVLANIALDDTLENVAARVSAAKVFVEGKGETPELPVDKLSEAYRKMKQVIEKQQNASNTTVTNPSPSTSIITVKASVTAQSTTPNVVKSSQSDPTPLPAVFGPDGANPASN